MTKLLTAAVVLIAAASLPGTWTSGPALPVARSEVAVATIVTRSVDRMYVIGGYANGNVDQSMVEVFTPIVTNRELTGAWRDVAPLPRGLNHIGAVGLEGKIYTFGGFAAQNDSAVADANVYDPATNRWTPIASRSSCDQHSVAWPRPLSPGLEADPLPLPPLVGDRHRSADGRNGKWPLRRRPDRPDQ